MIGEEIGKHNEAPREMRYIPEFKVSSPDCKGNSQDVVVRIREVIRRREPKSKSSLRDQLAQAMKDALEDEKPNGA